MDLVNHLNDRLLFAVPKKGRLQQASLNLLLGSDIQFHRHSRLDIALVKNLPIALVFLPAADIPTFVGEGRVDLGITGRDQVAEHEAEREAERAARRRAEHEAVHEQQSPPTADPGVEEVMKLNFGKCQLQVQVPETTHEGQPIERPEELIGKNIVTSFKYLVEAYFRKLEAQQDAGKGVVINGGKPKHELRTKIKYVGGSVEAACALGVAHGIVDLVESGETMRAAGLKPIATVLTSTAVLIKSRKPRDPALVNKIASRIRGVIDAQRYVLCQYNIQRGPKFDAACRITPGRRAPTVNDLVREGAAGEAGWVAVSSMVERERIADAMDELAEVGAEDILVLSLDNTRTG